MFIILYNVLLLYYIFVKWYKNYIYILWLYNFQTFKYCPLRMELVQKNHMQNTCNNLLSRSPQNGSIKYINGNNISPSTLNKWRPSFKGGTLWVAWLSGTPTWLNFSGRFFHISLSFSLSKLNYVLFVQHGATPKAVHINLF